MNKLERSTTRIAARVCKIKRFCNLRDHPDRERRREEEVSSLEVMAKEEEVLSRDIFEGDVVFTALLTLIDDLSDRGMSKMFTHLRFAEEHIDELLFAGKVRENPLNRCESRLIIFSIIASLEDLCHPTNVDPLDQGVVTEGLGLHEGALLGWVREVGLSGPHSSELVRNRELDES